MNIIAIEYEPSSQRGGQERSYFDILTRFQQKGHSVTLYYVVKGNLIEKYEQLEVVTVQIPTINLYNKLSIREIFAFIKSFLKFKNVKGSVIYINQIQDLPLAALLRHFKGARKLVCHLRLPPLYGHLKKTKNQISLLAKYIDEYIVANINMKEAHCANGVAHERIQIIPNGFDFSITYPRKSIYKENLKLAYIGRLEDGKGIKELISAMPTIKDKFPTIRLLIAGSPMNSEQNSYLEDCIALIEQLKLENNITFVGHQPNPIEFLKRNDITIFPSTLNESFGRVLVESIMAGVPVIARDVGATAEILGDKEKNWIYNKDQEIVYIIDSIIKFDNFYPLQQILEYQKDRFSINKVVGEIEQVLIQDI